MIGTERNIPGMPQTAPQKARLMMIPKDDSLSARPIIHGSITLPFRNWIAADKTKISPVVCASPVST